MTGNLAIQKTNAVTSWIDMNGNTERRRVWAGTANSNGDFFLYDGTKNRHIIHAPLNGIPQFSGELRAEKLTVTFAAGATTNKIYWAYKLGNLVFVNIRFTHPNSFSGSLGLVKLTDSEGNIIKPSKDNQGLSSSQLISGTYNPSVNNNSNGFNLTANAGSTTVPANSGIQFYGIFMCE